MALEQQLRALHPDAQAAGNKKERECYAHSSEVCLAGQEAWEHSQGKEFHGNSPPGALAFSLTSILIPYPRVSLVYGSMCSLLVLF